MSIDKLKQSKIIFDHNWYYCCLHSTDNIDINLMTNINNNNDHYWISIQLPHSIVNIEQDINNEHNWWYRKEFQWKIHPQNLDQRIYLIFEPVNDNHNSSIETLTVWLNEIQLFSDSFPSSKLSIDLTEHLVYINELEKLNHKNILVICCKNTSLSLHTYLLLPNDIIHTIEQQENVDTIINKTFTTILFGKNRVLDYLVHFNNNDGRFNIISNPKIKSSSILKQQNVLDMLVIKNNQDQIEEQTIDYNTNIEQFHVPRLAIVMLVVGTRGDVQPFIAFGKRLRAAGHRVRLATHEKFRSYVHEYGLEFFPLASNPDDLMSFMVKNGGIFPSINSIIEGDLIKHRHNISDILKSTWFACTQMDDETFIPFTADVIIANPPSFGHVHCAQKLQIPLHIVFTMPWSSTTVFPHAFCKVDYSKVSTEKMNLLSYSVIDALQWSAIRDLVNVFRRETLDLPPVHARQAVSMLMDENVPHTYCWSPSLVPRPYDWPSNIDIAGYFFLDTDNDHYKPSDDLINFLHLNNDEKIPPPIYIGFGSITGNDSQRLLQVILSALEKTNYRALLSGFNENNDELPEHILKIGDVPHDWLFQHVSAVCHHGGAGTTAAGLRAGKPSIIIPFFGDQFFWGNVVEKHGAGPTPLPGKTVTVDELIRAFQVVHEPEMRIAAERIRDAISHENGCETALRMFYANLPLSRMGSDLESTFPACYRVDEYDLQVSRPVAQVLVAAGALDESQFQPYPTREWTSIYDNRVHVPTSGVFKHTHKAFSHIFIHTTGGMKRAITSTNIIAGIVSGIGGAIKDIGQGIAHIPVGVLSLYGELTDVLDRVPSLYDPYSELDTHERPRVTDFKSGCEAATRSAIDGWKDGVTGFIRKPRIGYRRHGILGGATGALVATANGFVKPTVGSLASVTWLSRGIYASVKKKQKKKRNEEHIGINRSSFMQSSSPLSSRYNIDEEEQEEEEDDDDDDDDDDTPRYIKFAVVVSGYPAETCQQILDEFDKVKQHKEQTTTSPSNQTPKHRIRRHSDSAI